MANKSCKSLHCPVCSGKLIAGKAKRGRAEFECGACGFISCWVTKVIRDRIEDGLQVRLEQIILEPLDD